MKTRDEIWQYVSLGLMCLSKTYEFKQFEIYLKNQVRSLNVCQNSVAHSLNKELAANIARQGECSNFCHTRVLLVKWVLKNRDNYKKPISAYLRKVCTQWKDSHMTHINLIKQYVWDKAATKLIDLKQKLQDKNDIHIIPFLNEIEAFETVVMPHVNYEYFDYMRLVQSKNVFEGASRQCLPTLTRAAVNLAIPSQPHLKNYIVPTANNYPHISAYVAFIESFVSK